MICEKAIIPYIIVTDSLTATYRDSNGFRSTEKTEQMAPQTKPHDILPTAPPAPHIIPYNLTDIISDEDSIASSNESSDDIIGIVKNMTTTIDPTYHVSLSNNPFDDIVEIGISTRGRHSTLGI